VSSNIRYTHPILADVIFEAVYTFQKKDNKTEALDPLPIPVVAVACTGVCFPSTVPQVLTSI
jgi:hypothetical protein